MREPARTKTTTRTARPVSRLAKILGTGSIFLLCPFFLPAKAPTDTGTASTRIKARIFYYSEALKDSSLGSLQKSSFFDSLATLYAAEGREEEQYRTLKEKTAYLQGQGFLSEALKTCRLILDGKEGKTTWSHDDSMQYMETKLRSGIISISTGTYEEGASNLLDLLKMPVPDWVKLQANSYLGYIYMRNNRLDESRKYHEKALDIFHSMPEGQSKDQQQNILYNHIAGLYYSMQEYDSAILFLEKAVAGTPESASGRIFAYHNMALIYMEIGETRLAQEYLQKTIGIARQAGNSYVEAVALQNLAWLYRQNEEWEKAQALYLQALDIARKLDANDILSSMMIEYAELLFHFGRYQEFKDLYTAGIAKRDSVTGALNQEKMAALNYQYEAYKAASEKQLLEQELALTSLANQKKAIVLSILVAAMLVLTLLMLRTLKKVRKQDKENLRIHHQMEDIKESLTRQSREDWQHFESSIESKNRELASRSLHWVRVNEMLHQIDSEIGQLAACENAEERKHLAESMRKEIQVFDRNIDSWGEFKFYFEQIHKDFYSRLHTAAPTLSPVEQRLCALLASNLNTKEIAEISNRSVRTIETLIYHIRKKFQLPSNMNISLFLQQFLLDSPENPTD